VKLEVEAKKLVPKKFHKWIYVFGKKASEQMSTRKLWDHTIDVSSSQIMDLVFSLFYFLF